MSKNSIYIWLFCLIIGTLNIVLILVHGIITCPNHVYCTIVAIFGWLCAIISELCIVNNILESINNKLENKNEIS